jgi:predicted Zn-ribbon and HTH transcriptional regulator
MPVIFQARCGRCGFHSDIFPAQYGAVWVDEPLAEGASGLLAGAVLDDAARGSRLAEQPDPRLVVLAHPIEDQILKNLGYTWWSAGWSGRYVSVHRVVCRDCGTIFDRRRLAVPGTVGCGPGCVIGLVAGLAFWLVDGSACQGLMAGYLTALVFTWAAQLLTSMAVSRRHRDRAREIAGPKSCPRCGSRNHVGTERQPQELPCPACGEREYTVRAVGKS